MTVITLNLLAEEQIAQQERARDPVKTAILAGLGVALLVAVVGVLAIVLGARQKGAVTVLQEQLDRLDTPRLQEWEANLATLQKAADEIQTANRSRYLAAPQLALLKDLVPEKIQLSRVMLSIAVQTTPVEPPSGDGGFVSKHPPRPKETQRLILTLDGRVTSNRPELAVDDFIRTLREDATLNADMEQIQLRSITRGAIESQPTTFFVVECRFRERK